MRFIMKSKKIINLSVGRSNTKSWFENGFYIGIVYEDFYRVQIELDKMMMECYNIYRKEFGL